MMEILKVNDLCVSFDQYTKGLERRTIQVVEDVSFTVNENEIVAIFGESGSGKSLLAHALLDLLPSNAHIRGDMLYKGEPLNKEKIRDLRGNGIAFIPQTVKSLNPLLKVKDHFFSCDEDEAIKTLTSLCLDESVMELYPHELSGGMARRVLVALALCLPFDFLIADEPTPGMDRESLKETVSLFKELKKQGKTCLIISHDIETVLQVADRIGIFYDGRLIEMRDRSAFEDGGKGLKEEYSKALYNALPQNGFHVPKEEESCLK